VQEWVLGDIVSIHDRMMGYFEGDWNADGGLLGLVSLVRGWEG
jgi:hypothetical protein